MQVAQEARDAKNDLREAGNSVDSGHIKEKGRTEDVNELPETDNKRVTTRPKG